MGNRWKIIIGVQKLNDLAELTKYKELKKYNFGQSITFPSG